jgi:hypothetical protein
VPERLCWGTITAAGDVIESFVRRVGERARGPLSATAASPTRAGA